MVMGGDWRTRGRGLQSHHRILMEILHLILLYAFNVCLKKTENEINRGMDWPFFERLKTTQFDNAWKFGGVYVKFFKSLAWKFCILCF